MRRSRKKGGLMKILIPVLSYLAGVITGDLVQPILVKIPVLGGFVKKLDKDNSTDNEEKN